MKSRFPFTSFPNGWYRLAYSDELRPGQVKPLHYFDKDLVLFRTENGKAYVLDAHCPHLGAHLAALLSTRAHRICDREPMRMYTNSNSQLRLEVQFIYFLCVHVK